MLNAITLTPTQLSRRKTNHAGKLDLLHIGICWSKRIWLLKLKPGHYIFWLVKIYAKVTLPDMDNT